LFSDRLQRIGHSQDESGFTLLELLVVMLVIGILAAIAIPSFLNQKNKAVDAQAKEVVSMAQTAAEAVATDNNGGYEKVEPTELHHEESALRIASSTTEAYLGKATGSLRAYSLTAVATDGDELTISRSATGAIERTCVSPISKRGCNGGERSSW
jgi:type IV pilus assembly protein PilA